MTEMCAGDQIPKVSKARQSGRGNGACGTGTESQGVGGTRRVPGWETQMTVEEGKPTRRLSQ